MKTITKNGIEYAPEMPLKALERYIDGEFSARNKTLLTDKQRLEIQLKTLRSKSTVTRPDFLANPNAARATRNERNGAGFEAKMKLYEAITAIYNHDDSKKKALLIESSGGGANLLSPELYTEIQMLVEYSGVVPKEFFTIISTGQYQIKIPLLTVDPIVYIAGDGVTITGSDADFTAEITTLYTLGVITALTDELVQDTTPFSLVNKIIDRMAYKIAQKIDSLGFNGSGDSRFPGVIPSVEDGTGGTEDRIINLAAGKNKFKDVTYDQMIEMQSLIDDAGLGNAKYYMTNKMFTYLFLQKDDNNRPIWQMSAADNDTNTKGGKIERSLNGYPVIIVNQMPGRGAVANEAGVCAVLFGDMMQAHVVAWDPATEVFEGREATVGTKNAFTDNLRLIRTTQRIGMNVLFPKVVSAIFTAAS